MPSKEDRAETARIESRKVIPSASQGRSPIVGKEDRTETALIENRKQNAERSDILCYAPAPGGSLRKCELSIDHNGIHRDGALAWFGAHWA